VQTNACESTTDRRAGDRADTSEDDLQTPPFVKGGNRTCCCSQCNEGDEDGCPHVKNSSNEGYMLAVRWQPHSAPRLEAFWIGATQNPGDFWALSASCGEHTRHYRS
jgi:hypothetical protein